MKSHFFSSSPPAAGRFSRFRLRGKQEARRYTTAYVRGPGRSPCRVIWASKAKRADSFSRGCVLPRRPAQDDGNPQFQLRCTCDMLYEYLCITPPSKRFALRQPRSHGTTAVELQATSFVTASVGACACARACEVSRNRGSETRAVQCAIGFALEYLPRMLRRTMATHNPSEFQKQPRSHT